MTASRYANRTSQYHKHRPQYASHLIREVLKNGFLKPGMLAADIGAGTGRLSEVLVQAGLQVRAIEPDKSMRAFIGELFTGHPEVQVIDGTAEQTGLADGSVDVVTAGQAFHWFNRAEALPEFRRILRSPKKLLTIDNRPAEGSLWWELRAALRPFDIHNAYTEAKRRNSDESREALFKQVTTDRAEFAVRQSLGEVERRLESQSSKPLPGQQGHAEMTVVLRDLFEKHQEDGLISLDYVSRLHYGTI